MQIPTTQFQIPTTQPEIPTTQPEISTTLFQILTTFPQIKNIEATQILINNTTIKEEDSEIEKSIENHKTEAITEKIKESMKIDDNCTIEGIIYNSYQNEDVNENKSEEIYNKLKEECLNLECAKQNKIVETENIVYQVSTLRAQKNNNNSKVSSIDLGECEDKLRKENNMADDDEFIIYKKDIKDGLTTYVEYEIYKANNLEPLNLDICNDTQISINIPVNLKEETQLLYDKMSKLGYNLFNANDSFYNDICATYTSESGTDMLLSDRKQDIFKNNGNLTLCQSGCQLKSYNSETKKASCSCSVQKTKNIDIKKIDTSGKFDKQVFADSFFETLKNSNLMVIKCYKLVLSLGNLLKNIGRLIMSGILGIIVLLIFVCIIIEKNKINVFVSTILRNILYNNNKIEKKRNNSQKLKKNKIKKSKKRSRTFRRLKKKELKILSS